MILKKIIKLANRLDKLKLVKEADLADSVIRSLAQMNPKYLPHDDDDEEEMDAEFEDYLSGLDSGEYTEPEEEEMLGGKESDLRAQLEAITRMLDDDRLSDSEKEMLAGILRSTRLELGDEQKAWGLGGSVVGEEPFFGADLPVAEASKKR